MKKILLAAAACSLLALGLTGCPQPQTSSSTGNDGAAAGSK
jgi:hypothetical protein